MLADRHRRIFQFILASVFLGVVVSQYLPFFGSPQQTLAPAWSPLKKELMGNHAVLFVLPGGVAGWFYSRFERGLLSFFSL